MREKFIELTERYPNHSSFIVYGRLIKMTPKEGWNRRKIVKWFNLLVDPTDYLKSDKVSLLEGLIKNYV
jgi:hypothetical protein